VHAADKTTWSAANHGSTYLFHRRVNALERPKYTINYDTKKVSQL
jgi:hypothetical protein